MRGRACQGQERLPIGGADRELDERCPRVGGWCPFLADRQAALPGHEVGVDRVHTLVRHRLEQSGEGRGANRCALARGDLARVRQRQRIEGARGELARQDREPSTELHVGTQAGRGLRWHGRRIHGVRRGDAGERHDDLLGHLEADPILRLGRRCAEVRCQHDVGRPAKRIVGSHRLGGVDIHRGPGEVARVQRIRQGGLVHDPAARDVEDEGSALRRLQLGPADEPAGMRCQRGMHGDHVGPMQELREAHQARTGLGHLLRRSGTGRSRGPASRSRRRVGRPPCRSSRARRCRASFLAARCR